MHTLPRGGEEDTWGGSASVGYKSRRLCKCVCVYRNGGYLLPSALVCWIKCAAGIYTYSLRVKKKLSDSTRGADKKRKVPMYGVLCCLANFAFLTK